MAKSAAEIIAFHFGSDIADIRDAIYQPTRYRPSIYTVYTKAGDYWTAPPAGQKPHKAFSWEKVATYYGRDVYVSKGAAE